jgi:hypothetical protein
MSGFNLELGDVSQPRRDMASFYGLTEMKLELTRIYESGKINRGMLMGGESIFAPIF